MKSAEILNILFLFVAQNLCLWNDRIPLATVFDRSTSPKNEPATKTEFCDVDFIRHEGLGWFRLRALTDFVRQKLGRFTKLKILITHNIYIFNLKRWMLFYVTFWLTFLLVAPIVPSNRDRVEHLSKTSAFALASGTLRDLLLAFFLLFKCIRTAHLHKYSLFLVFPNIPDAFPKQLVRD